MLNADGQSAAVKDSGEEVKARAQNKPEEVQALKVPKSGSLGVLVAIATIIALVGSGVLFLYKTKQNDLANKQEQQFKSLQEEIDRGELGALSLDLEEVNAGNASLKSALSGRMQWSKFWRKISELTPKAVYYNSMSIDQAGTVSISGAGSNLTSVAKLMVSLQSSPLFEDVKLGGTSAKIENEKAVTAFSVTLKVNSTELGKDQEEK